MEQHDARPTLLRNEKNRRAVFLEPPSRNKSVSPSSGCRSGLNTCWTPQLVSRAPWGASGDFLQKHGFTSSSFLGLCSSSSSTTSFFSISMAQGVSTGSTVVNTYDHTVGIFSSFSFPPVSIASRKHVSARSFVVSISTRTLWRSPPVT